jgi:hypothetical protein
VHRHRETSGGKERKERGGERGGKREQRKNQRSESEKAIYDLNGRKIPDQ